MALHCTIRSPHHICSIAYNDYARAASIWVQVPERSSLEEDWYVCMCYEGISGCPSGDASRLRELDAKTWFFDEGWIENSTCAISSYLP